MRPTLTKKTGMKKPNPAPSSLVRKCGWVIRASRSISDRIAPAVNAPRITSRPRFSASATKAAISRKAPRTRIWAVVSCRRTSAADSRRECSSPIRPTTATAASTTNPPSSRSLVPVPVASREKKRVSRMMVAKSAIEAAAIVSWPNALPSLAGVLQQRDDDPERGRRQDDRDDQAVLHLAGRRERAPHGERDREGEPRSRGRPGAAAARAAARSRSPDRPGTAGRPARRARRRG